MGVSPAALAAVRDDERLAIGHILNDTAAVAVADDRAGRDRDIQVLAALAEELALLAVRAVFCGKLPSVLEFDQRILSRVDGENHIAAAAAVSAVRAALGDIFFAAEGNAAVAAVARLDVDIGLVNKHNDDHSFCAAKASFLPKSRDFLNRKLVRLLPSGKSRQQRRAGKIPGAAARGSVSPKAKKESVVATRATAHSFCFFCLFRVNADLFASALQRLELHDAVRQREKRIIRPSADVDAGMDLRAALAHDDVAGDNRLPVRLLHAEPL